MKKKTKPVTRFKVVKSKLPKLPEPGSRPYKLLMVKAELIDDVGRYRDFDFGAESIEGLAIRGIKDERVLGGIEVCHGCYVKVFNEADERWYLIRPTQIWKAFSEAVEMMPELEKKGLG